MSTLNIEMQAVILLLATLLTGLSAGLCFTWTNAVTAGIGKLSDVDYLQAFQQMNRTILNPLFFVVFFGPIFLLLSSIYIQHTTPGTLLWPLILATLLYLFGVIMITIIGNVPLNEMLDQTDINQINEQDIRSLRKKFESKWNNFHLVRTICSCGSFTLLIVACLTKNS